MNRIASIDSIKGFAIFLVVFGHLLQGKLFPEAGLLHEWIYSFHMPLFMFLSGIFAYKIRDAVNNNNGTAAIIKKAQQLLLPFFVWTVLYCIFRHENIADELILRGRGHYWFLSLLFLFFSIEFCLNKINYHIDSERINQDKNRGGGKWLTISRLCAFILVCLIPSNVIAANIVNKDCFIFNYPFFLFGLYLGEHLELVRYLTKDYVGIPSVLIFALLSYHPLNICGYTFPAAVFAILTTFYIFNKIAILRDDTNRISQWGKVTLDIYLIHHFLTGLVPNGLHSLVQGSLLSLSGLQTIFLASISSITIIELSIVLGKILKSNSLTSKLLFGNFSKGQ